MKIIKEPKSSDANDNNEINSSYNVVSNDNDKKKNCDLIQYFSINFIGIQNIYKFRISGFNKRYKFNAYRLFRIKI